MSERQIKVVNVAAKANSISGGTLLDTGVMIMTGQALRVRVFESDTWSAGTGPRTSTANGLGNPLGNNFGLHQARGFSFLFGSLVGTLDDGKTWFPVGTELMMQNLGPSGTLKLAYWDSNNADNSGSIAAEITVRGEPA